MGLFDKSISLTKKFEDDYCSATTYLSSDDMQGLYNLKKFEVFGKMRTL